MNLVEIKNLIDIVEKSTLTEFSIRDKDLKITMSKGNKSTLQQASTAVEENTEVIEQQVISTREGETLITSPMVGTFYSATSPDMPALIKAGDKVKAGQILCILEAMKMMNNLECEYDCEIEEVLVSNEQRVGYAQALFRVKKI